MAITKKYENNAGVVGVTSVAKGYDAVGLYGAEPAGTAQTGVYFYKSGSRRKFGSQVRYLIASKDDGPVTPSGSQPKQTAHVTIGTQATFNSYGVGAQLILPLGTYIVTGKKDEG